MCDSCASLAGLVLTFIACFILLVIAPSCWLGLTDAAVPSVALMQILNTDTSQSSVARRHWCKTVAASVFGEYMREEGKNICI